MKILQWNLRGYYARLPMLQRLIEEVKPDILCLQETHLKPNKTLKLKYFQQPPSRTDRINNDGGGVLIYANSSVPCVQHPVQTPLESASSKIFINEKEITLISLYLPPDLSNAGLYEELDNLIHQIDSPFILTCDANGHHPSWGSNYSDRRGVIIDEWTTNHNLTLLNHGDPTYVHPNGRQTHIDVTIVSNDIATYVDWCVHPQLHNSDHYPILIDINLQSTPTSTPCHWHLKTADWETYRKTLTIPTEFISPTQACKNIEDCIVRAAEMSVKRSSRELTPKYTKCWWTKECNKTNREMKKAFNRYKNNLGNLEMFIDFKKKRAIFRRTVKEARASSWQHFLSTIDLQTPSSSVWRKIRALNNSYSKKQIVLNIENEVFHKPEEVSNLFANYFTRFNNSPSNNPNFLNVQRNSLKLLFLPGSELPYNKCFKICELDSALLNKKSTAPGPDSIPYEFLKQTSKEQRNRLLSFFNYVWNTGIPHQWRLSTVAPILKPGKVSTCLESYRPISLTNCLCKIMERMVNCRLLAYCEERNLIDPSQSGFRALHSTLDPIARLESEARSAMLAGNYCIAVFLDISKAFDSVWHNGLYIKLSKAGLKGNLPYFIQQFLSMRKIEVKVNESKSAAHTTSCGVPQGSVISPTLFMLMMNDIFNELSEDIKYSIYADDCALWISGKCINKLIESMQGALRKVEEWTEKWGFNMAPHKTKAMVFTNRRKYHTNQLSMTGCPIEFVKTFKFLGVVLDSKLTWARHVRYVRDRCQGDLRLMSVVSARGWGADTQSLRKLYTSLIRPKLEYGCFLFANAAPSILIMLDRIQYAAIRIILGLLRCTPVNLIEAEAGLMPLSIRRKMIMTKYAYRMLTIENHPLRKGLCATNNFKTIENKYNCLPIISRMQKELEEVGIKTREVPTVPISTIYGNDENVRTSLYTVKKDELGEREWRALFEDLKCSTYSGISEMYSDGSVADGKSACAVFSEQLKICYSLPGWSSCFTAELNALCKAVNIASENPLPTVIFTDSLSSVRALTSTKPRRNHLISNILKNLSNNSEIFIEWIPSHVGIFGNEEADRLAKSCLNAPPSPNALISKEDAYRLIDEFYQKEWIENWNNCRKNYRRDDMEINLCLNSTLTRREEICIARLHLRTCKLTHEHYYSNKNPPICATCQQRETLQHVLVSCPTLAAARSPLEKHCKTLKIPFNLDSLLSTKFPPELLLHFMNTTSTFMKI